MKTRLLLTCLAATAVTFSGCDKIKSLSPFKSKTVEAQTAPAPTPAVEAAAAPQALAPEPTPEPAPAAPVINQNAGVIVLCYHRFENKPDNLAITPQEFEQQLQALKDHGISVIPMQDFLAWRRGEKDIPAKSAVITIDDGYVSAYDVAWPILKKFEYPFTMFVYIEYIGVGGKSVSWDQLAQMRDAGVDIQSHTYSHQSLRGKGNVNKKNVEEIKRIGYEAWLQKEIGESKNVLERQLAIRVNSLAYPYGLFNQEAQDMALKTGYEAAFTVYGQRNGFSSPSATQIGRYAIGSKEPHIFQAALHAIGSGPVSVAPAVAQMAAASMATQPMEGETISDPKPLIKANLATMGAIEPDSVEMRISGFGLVPAVYDPATKMVSFQLANQPLRDRNYTVIISAKVGGRKAETRWSFQFDPSAAGAR